MDLKSLEASIGSPESAYALWAGAGVVAGYLLTRLTGAAKRAGHRHEELMVERTAEQRKHEAQIAGARDAVKLREMEYAENERAHERMKELNEINRQRSLEDRDYAEREREKRAAAFVPLAEKVGQYLAERLRPEREVDSKLAEKREEYREELVDEFMKNLKENAEPFDEEYDASDEDRERIERLVDLRYPVQALPSVPEELRKLITLLERDAPEHQE